MKSPHYFIVSPLNGEKYKHKTDSGIIINTSIEDGLTTQRLAVVEETPIGYTGVIEKGNIVVVHHNTFRTELNRHGVPLPNKRNIKDDLYYIEEELIYLVNKGDEIVANLNYCFVTKVYHICDINKDERVKEQYGKVVYPNQRMINKGVVAGMEVGFKKDSEYEFNIFGQDLYMMKDHRILLVV